MTLTPAQWQHHITAWQHSHQSKSAYCKEHGLAYSRFLYWNKRRTQSEQPSPNTELLPVTVTDDESAPAAPCLGVVEFANGTKLHIHSHKMFSTLPALVSS
jgi:hypothetical protein